MLPGLKFPVKFSGTEVAFLISVGKAPSSPSLIFAATVNFPSEKCGGINVAL